MATSRRRTAKKNIGQNLNELESRVKRVERRPRSSIGSYSVTSDLIAPGAITLEKLDPTLVQMLLDMSHNNDSTGETVEYVVSGGTDGNGLVTGIVDSVISEYNFSTTSASGKNSIFWQSTEPTGGEYADGDLWYDTSLDTDGLPKYTPYKYNGTTADWEVAALGDGAFRFLDAGKISTGILDAGIAIRVGTYPLNSAPVGKSRVEIASSFPTRQAATGEDPATIATFSGIRVLRKTTESQTETTGFYQSLEINADTGRFRVGGSEEYLLYDSSTDKLLLSGKLITGTDENGNTTNESLFIGSDLSDGKDGIRLGPYNYWYRPASVVTGSDFIFKVGANKTNNAISVTKDGDVDVQGMVSPVGGTIRGRLAIRLGEDNASDKFVIGQNLPTLSGLSGDEFDGIKLDSNNYWVLSNNAKKPYLKVGTATKYLLFDGSLLKLTGGDITLTAGGTFKTQDANSRIEINANGIYGYYNGNQKFYINTSDGTASFEGTTTGTTNPTGGTITGRLTVRGIEGAVNRILIGQDVQSNRDGIKLDDYNLWTVSNTGTSASFSVGTSSSNLSYTSNTGLKLIGGDITLVSTGGTGGTFKTQDGNSRIEINANGIYGYYSGSQKFVVDVVTGTASFEGTTTGITNPTGGTVSGKLTIQNSTYAFGKGVMSSPSRDGLYLNANNYWTLTQTTPASAQFKVGDSTQYVEWTGDTLKVAGTVEATAGKIGGSTGWTIGGGYLYGTSIALVPATDFGSGALLFSSNGANLLAPGIRVVSNEESGSFLSISGSFDSALPAKNIYITAGNHSGSRGIVNITGNVTIDGNLTVTGTGGGGGSSYSFGTGLYLNTATNPDTVSNAGYRNAGSGGLSDPPTSGNKITYGSTVPGSGTGRTDGDVHFII